MVFPPISGAELRFPYGFRTFTCTAGLHTGDEVSFSLPQVGFRHAFGLERPFARRFQASKKHVEELLRGPERGATAGPAAFRASGRALRALTDET